MGQKVLILTHHEAVRVLALAVEPLCDNHLPGVLVHAEVPGPVALQEEPASGVGPFVGVVDRDADHVAPHRGVLRDGAAVQDLFALGAIV